MNKNLRKVVAIVMLVCVPAVSAAGVTTESLKQGILAGQSRIRAWYIEYESSADSTAGAPGKYVHRTIAAIAPDCLYHWGAHGTARYGWRDDPYQQRLVIHGGSAVIEFPAARSYHPFSMKSDEPLPGTAAQEFLFLALGWWPWPSRPAPRIGDRTPCALRDIATSPDYQLATSQQLIDGRRCSILEFPGHDRLWFDVERNCTLVAREIDDPATHLPIQRIGLGEFRQLEPGVWVPMQWRNTLYDGTNKAVDSTVHVLEARLNDHVPRSLFEFIPRPGSVRIDDDGQYQQAVPGGVDYLDDLIGWIKRQSPESSGDGNRSGASVEAVGEYGICLIAAIVMCIRFVRSRRRVRRGV